MSQNSETEKRHVSFAAIDQWVDNNIIFPTEKTVSARNMVEWGTRNAYPDYLLDLYKNVTTLRSIINGNIDFITGDDISILPLNGRFADGVMNTRGVTIREQVRDLAKDYEIYGGFALQVIRDHFGDVAEIHYLDMRYLRSNKENDVFYYNEHWNKGGRHDAVEYPCFMPNLDWASLDDEQRNRHASSVLYVKNVHTQTYPAPLYAASILACETERAIDEYHWNAINNGFSSSMIVNFNNGDPGDKIKEEIEDDFTDKFSGHQNAGRIMFSWNKDKESATTFETPNIEDFGDRYTALSNHVRRQIFSAFRAIPLLFGLTSEANTGFSTDEFEQSFRLYNRTQIRPIQRMIAEAYDKIYGQSSVLSIKPFSLDGADTNVD